MRTGTYISNSYLHGCTIYVCSHAFLNISFPKVIMVNLFSVLLPTWGGISETDDEKKAF